MSDRLPILEADRADTLDPYQAPDLRANMGDPRTDFDLGSDIAGDEPAAWTVDWLAGRATWNIAR